MLFRSFWLSDRETGATAFTSLQTALAICSGVCPGQQRILPSVSLNADSSDEDGPPRFLEPSTPDGVDELLGRMDAASPLADCKWRHTGTAQLGVEALELKIKGLTGPDIAQMYHTTPNNVGARISRAVKRVRREFAAWPQVRLAGIVIEIS